MRRALGLMLLTTLLVGLFAAPAVADDATGLPVVVAAAAGDSQGPDPMPRDAENNPARELAGYEDPDVPFTWGAAWILTVTGMIGLALLAGLYYFGVHRPSKQTASES